MLSFEEISKNKAEGKYVAIAASGKRYEATFVNAYTPEGVMFFCIPSGETILGYEKI